MSVNSPKYSIRRRVQMVRRLPVNTFARSLVYQERTRLLVHLSHRRTALFRLKKSGFRQVHFSVGENRAIHLLTPDQDPGSVPSELSATRKQSCRKTTIPTWSVVP